MAYLARFFQPDLIYFVTSRTIDGTLFLRPSREVNNVVGAVLADAQERYGVEIFDFVFLSNHMHIAVRSRAGNIPPFMQYVKANIAVLVNADLGRRGHLWERRYMASPILDEGGQIDRAVYIYGHGVKEGLVDSAASWPGNASAKERLSGKSPSYQRVDQAALTRAILTRKTPPNPKDFTRTVSVKLSSWPFLEGLTELEARREVANLVAIAEERAAEARQGAPALGVDRILGQDPWTRPTKPLNRTPNPLSHAESREKRTEFREAYSIFLDDYGLASRRFRDGELGVPFPRYSFRPPLPLYFGRGGRAGPGPSPSAVAH